jgi:uncharacterized protein (DUF302 family)
MFSLTAAADEMVTKPSAHSVKATLDRLESALQEKGIKVAARWDHAAGGASVGMPLRPIEVIIFGNPKLGTPLMQSNPRIGVDLPLKVLAWEDDAGKVWIGYTAPKALGERYDIKDRDEVIKQITGALDALTTRAASK